MKQKIYNGWAFTENETAKGQSNRDIHKELTEKYDVYRSDISSVPSVEEERYDVIIGRKAGYNHAVYTIIKNAPELNTDELLLLCDQGNLCFGGSRISSKQFRVNED